MTTTALRLVDKQHEAEKRHLVHVRARRVASTAALFMPGPPVPQAAALRAYAASGFAAAVAEARH